MADVNYIFKMNIWITMNSLQELLSNVLLFVFAFVNCGSSVSENPSPFIVIEVYLLRGLKRPECEVYNSPSSAEVSIRMEIYLLATYTPFWHGVLEKE
jgi:hypothetical protein